MSTPRLSGLDTSGYDRLSQYRREAIEMLRERKTWFDTTVRHPESGYVFGVAGYAVRGYRSSFTDPGEAGRLEDYVITLEGADVTDIISDRVHQAVVGRCEEELYREGIL
jgi:hypothetical protein